MQEYVDQGKVAGLVTLIARKGTVPYLKAFGKLDLAKGSPMPANAIFRIASQTKAVTSVAVMMLQEEGKLLIDDPVAKYIPEFAGARVAVQAAEKDAKGFTTVPVKRPITIRDLLTHTAGISYGSGPARELYTAAGISGWFLADKPMPIGEVIKKLATLPFDAQPGEKFIYGYNTDILGYLVERVSGMSLADFFTNRMHGPARNDGHDISFYRRASWTGSHPSMAWRRRAASVWSRTRGTASTSRGPGCVTQAAPACCRPPRTTHDSCRCS